MSNLRRILEKVLGGLVGVRVRFRFVNLGGDELLGEIWLPVPRHSLFDFLIGTDGLSKTTLNALRNASPQAFGAAVARAPHKFLVVPPNLFIHGFTNGIVNGFASLAVGLGGVGHFGGGGGVGDGGGNGGADVERFVIPGDGGFGSNRFNDDL